MHHLAELTGQDDALAQITQSIRSGRKECIIVSGPPGSGVSWTLNQAGVSWEHHKGGVALKATGMAMTPLRPLLPWLTMVSPARNTLARIDVLKEGVAAASKGLPVVGGAASYLVGEVLNYRKKNLARQTQVLNDKEQDLLYVMERSAHGKRLMLLLDQMTDWDSASWSLLEIIVSPILHDLYPSLKDLVIVMGVDESLLPRCHALAGQLPTTSCHLKRIARDGLEVALESLGLGVSTANEGDDLYEATAGRLDLLHDFAALNTTSGGIAAIETGNFYGQMIERRLRALKGDIGPLEQLLAAASFLGNSFLLEEAVCLTGYPVEDLNRLLLLAKEERLLALSQGYVSFPSVAMQRYFRSSRVIDSKAKEYHGKFAQCLRRLRPGDYLARARHHYMAGEMKEAMTCQALACLEARRERGTELEGSPFDGLSEWTEYAEYLRAMRDAHDAYDSDAISEGITRLDGIEAILPDPLIAERDQIKARLLLKSSRSSHFKEAAQILQRWLGLENGESELWSRIGHSLIVALIHTSSHQEALRLEEALAKYYGNRRSIDPWSIYGLNCLRSSSECLHQLVPARIRLRSALAYFGSSLPGELPRHPLKYYQTLNNLVSNLIAGGAFEEALAEGSTLEELVRQQSSFPWPSIEVAANNLILAGFLSGSLPIDDALIKFREIDQPTDELGDHILIRNNVAVLLALQGQQNEAAQILEGIRVQLGNRGESDAYHRYFVANNLAGLIALNGNAERAVDLLEDAGRDLDLLFPAIREVLTRRHRIMPEVLRAASGLHAAEYDAFLGDHHLPQVGPQWGFYGRGFLLSDIQFWASD